MFARLPTRSPAVCPAGGRTKAVGRGIRAVHTRCAIPSASRQLREVRPSSASTASIAPPDPSTGFRSAPPAPSAGLIGRLTDITRLARRIAPLGARWKDRARLFAAPFALVLARRLGLRGRVGDRGVRPQRAVHDRALLAAADVGGDLQDGDDAIEPLREPRTIVDLGSNIGLSILYFRLRFPRARIIGVEPNPLAFELLRRNVGRCLTSRSVMPRWDRHAVVSPGRDRIGPRAQPRGPAPRRGAGGHAGERAQ